MAIEWGPHTKPASGTHWGTDMTAELNITAIERKSIGVGSIVRLKSGGPNMTVSERSSESAHCYWHTENGECHFSWLPLRVLELKP